MLTNGVIFPQSPAPTVPPQKVQPVIPAKELVMGIVRARGIDPFTEGAASEAGGVQVPTQMPVNIIQHLAGVEYGDMCRMQGQDH